MCVCRGYINIYSYEMHMFVECMFVYMCMRVCVCVFVFILITRDLSLSNCVGKWNCYNDDTFPLLGLFPTI